MAAKFSNFPHHLQGNALIEEPVEDRVGAGGRHAHQVKDREPNHDHLVSEEIKHFSQDAEHTEGKPAGKFSLEI